MLQPGEQLGNYVIESTLGAGGMGVVYAARHQAMGTEHAVKVLSANLALNPQVRARLLAASPRGAFLATAQRRERDRCCIESCV